MMADEGVRIILPEDASPELVERVRDAFPDAVADLAEAPARTLDAALAPDQLSRAEEALAQAAAAAPAVPAVLAEWFSGLPGGGLWFFLLLAVALLAAWAVERGVMLAYPRFRADREPEPSFRVRLPRAARFFAGRLLGLVVFAVAATALGRLILPEMDFRTRLFAREVLDAILFVRAIYAFFVTLAAPGAPGRRPMGFTDGEAVRIARITLVAMSLFGAISALSEAARAAAEGPSEVFARLVLILLGGLVTAGYFLALNAPVARLIARNGEAPPRGWAGAVAMRWAWIYAGVVALDMLLKALGAIGALGPGAEGGAGPSIMILVVAPLAVAALIAWRAEGPAQAGIWPGVFALLEGAIIVTAAVMLLRAWGVDPFAPAPPGSGALALLLPGLVEATVIVVVGVALARAAMTILGGGVKGEAGALVDEENPTGATRLDTVMPILRGFAVAAIAIVTALMALTAIGVDTAPLLAGAGVLGLALGFGAQQLVSDVISGLFYLYEDAFRMGEYIETKSGKGVVENISLRSVRLRHHRGPVFTIPFSDMGTIQNHSRDWVKIKFTFLVPSDTDVEMVRKLVKKVGAALEEDPELEGKFLEPLKSQGAIGIRGRAYEIGCKFTSRPGQQFLIRRKAYAALQKALEEKDIDLFAPQLTLASDDPSSAVPLAADGQPQQAAPA